MAKLNRSSPAFKSSPRFPASGAIKIPTAPPMCHQGFAEGGPLNRGDLLVSNFNDSSNAQGSGTTIVKVAPDGQLSTFFQGNTGLGLTLALGVLKRGFVLVGNVPTTDGTDKTVQQGSMVLKKSA